MAVLAVASCVATSATVPSRADDTPVSNKVNLQLQISGVTAEGATLEIRPGHGDCRFTPVTKKLPAPAANHGTIKLSTIELDCSSTHADRDCAFAITIKEPGCPPRTYRRGIALKVAGEGKPKPVQSLPCLLSAPSLAVKEVSKTRR